jgi:ABC-type bacteriocin/lantibiotic exporter with double-glycine peptidase domain
VAGVVLSGGTGHFIALVSRSGDQITVVDPLKGRFTVSDVELKQKYHFSGVFLLIRRQS